MKKGDYLYHIEVGTLKILKIEQIEDSIELQIHAQTLTDVFQFPSNSQGLRSATVMEQVDYEVDLNSLSSNWYKLREVFPNVQTFFDQLVEETFHKFIKEKPNFTITKFGADINVF
jgi:hypothetical protein